MVTRRESLPAEADAASAPARPPHSEARRDRWIAIGLALAVCLSALATLPFAGVAMNDDASYAHSAREFAEKGRFIYNGWGTPILIPQILYGAALIKLFGFSYLALDMSGIFFGGASAALMYLLCRACGLVRRIAVLCTGILLLNPISLALMPSFMTEMPSLAMLLASLLALARSTHVEGGNTSISRTGLFLSALLAIIAGSNRQPFWAAYLGALIPLFVTRTKDRLSLAIVAGTVILSAVSLTVWFSRQPFAASPPLSGIAMAAARDPMRPLLNAYELLNLGSLLTLPLLLLLKPVSHSRTVVLGACIVSLVLCALPFDHKLWAERGEYLTLSGVGVILVENQWQDPAVIESILRFGLRAVAAVVLALALLALRRREAQTRTYDATDRSGVVGHMMLGTAGLQMAVLIPWFSFNYVFDRYLVGLLPGVLIFIGHFIQQTVPSQELTRKLPRASGALLILWALAIAFVWDYMRYTDARVKAYDYLASKGVARDRFDGGIEFNNDTQLRLGGQLRSPLVKERGKVVAIRPAYFVTTTPTVEWAATTVDRRVTYLNIIPPFRKTLYVLKVTGLPVRGLRTR